MLRIPIEALATSCPERRIAEQGLGGEQKVTLQALLVPLPSREGSPVSRTATLPSNSMTLDQVIARLSAQDQVDGILTIGSVVKGELTAASDYDLVLFLSHLPAHLHVGVTYVDGRLTDLIFLDTARIERVLSLDQPVDGDAWVGRTVRWLQAGQITFDRTGKLRQAQEKVQGGKWLLEMTEQGAYGAWFGVNFNLAHTRRMLASDDPVYLSAADLRMALYGTMDLVFHYWRIRNLRWEGDKQAIRYLSAQDPAYLRLLEQFIVEGDRRRKLALYEQLAEMATEPLGGLWPEGTTAMQFDAQAVSPDMVETALRFWEELIAG